MLTALTILSAGPESGSAGGLPAVWLLAIAPLVVFWLALWMDRLWGEPPAAVHPVVAMGFYLRVVGRITTRCPPAPAFVLGTLAWWLGAAVVGLLAAAVQFGLAWALVHSAATPDTRSVIQAALMVLLVAWMFKTMFSWRMLRDEVGAVDMALGQSLAAGRERLSWLVSRDTTQLSAAEVRESAIESLAENLNDSVVAPVFWFVLFGLPGAAIYRFANTADAMWGYRGSYRGQHWEWAGKWAAWADDVLSWVPARITAWLIVVLAGRLAPGRLRAEATKTPSPNSGWPMAAMALVLGVSLRKPGVYTLNAEGRPPESADCAAAQRHAGGVVGALALLATAAMLMIAAALLTGLEAW